MDDILIQSEAPEYIQSTLNFFDHDARVWGLDMNVSKTEVQAIGNSPQRDSITTSHNIFSTINPDTGRPLNFYKYLGVYLYTQHHSKQLTSALRAKIRAYFANIDPLTLRLSEKIRVVNKQLHLMIADRLLGHCLPVETLNLFEKDIWRALQRSSITPKVSPMDRPQPRSQGGREISSLPIMVHVQIVNSALRCLTRVAPVAVADAVTASLFSHTPNPLQNMIIDSAHFLQLSYHSMGVWRHTPVQHLQAGETLVVHYRKHGQCIGQVSSTSSKTATLLFHDGTATINNDTNFTSHFPVHTYHPYPYLPHQILSLTFLRPQQLIPDAPLPPHDGVLLDTSIHGSLFLLPVAHSLSEVDLANWNCTAAAALTHASDADTVWVYSDGSSGNVGHAAAATIFLPGGHTCVLVQTSPLPTSASAEFWAACIALKLIRRLCPHHRIHPLIDNFQVAFRTERRLLWLARPNNFQVADLINRVILTPSGDFYLPSGTWAAAFPSLLADGGKLNVHTAWIKGHVGFLGNEVSDHYANWGAFYLLFDRSLLPLPPSRHLQPTPPSNVSQTQNP